MPEINITWEQAEMLGIVFCKNCKHRTNNHFNFGANDKPCAHCKCKNLERAIFLPKENEDE